MALYGGRLRVRVGGLLRQADTLLLVNHRGLTDSGTFWSPPGGGIEVGETAAVALRREFAEETGLLIEVGRLIGVTEYVAPPLHAIELFFEVKPVGGVLRVGTDPEMAPADQLIHDVRAMPFAELKALPATDLHALLTRCDSLDALFRPGGHFNQL